MDDEERTVEEDGPKQYYALRDGVYVPVSMFEITGRNGEYTSRADAVSATAVREIKSAMIKKAKDGDVAAAKYVMQLWKEQQQTKGVGKTTKKIDLGFGG